LNVFDLHGVDAVDKGSGKCIFHPEKNTDLLHVILQVVTNLRAVRSLETGELEISLQHAQPPMPVVAGVVSPDVELAGDAFRSEDVRNAFIGVPALIVDAGGEDVFVAPVLIEIPGVVQVREVVHGDVEVAVVVVVAGEKAAGVECAADGEHGGEDVGVAQGEVQCVVAAEAAADGGELGTVVLLMKEGENLLHQILLVLHVTGDAPAGRNGAVVPALGVNRIDADELQATVFELVVDGVDHAAIFELEEAAAGCWEDESGRAIVPEDEQLHLSPQGGGRPFVVFAFHRLPSTRATLPLLCRGKSRGAPFLREKNAMDWKPPYAPA